MCFPCHPNTLHGFLSECEVMEKAREAGRGTVNGDWMQREQLSISHPFVVGISRHDVFYSHCADDTSHQIDQPSLLEVSGLTHQVLRESNRPSIACPVESNAIDADSTGQAPKVWGRAQRVLHKANQTKNANPTMQRTIQEGANNPEKLYARSAETSTDRNKENAIVRIDCDLAGGRELVHPAAAKLAIAIDLAHRQPKRALGLMLAILQDDSVVEELTADEQNTLHGSIACLAHSLGLSFG
jgi:hypothetical protein